LLQHRQHPLDHPTDRRVAAPKQIPQHFLGWVDPPPHHRQQHLVAPIQFAVASTPHIALPIRPLQAHLLAFHKCRQHSAHQFVNFLDVQTAHLQKYTRILGEEAIAHYHALSLPDLSLF
jgi:hypothetical protein